MLLNTSEVHEDVEREFIKNSSLFHILRDPLTSSMSGTAFAELTVSAVQYLEMNASPLKNENLSPRSNVPTNAQSVDQSTMETSPIHPTNDNMLDALRESQSVALHAQETWNSTKYRRSIQQTTICWILLRESQSVPLHAQETWNSTSKTTLACTMENTSPNHRNTRIIL